MKYKFILYLAVLSLLPAGFAMADDFSECKKDLTEQLEKNNPQAEKITFEETRHRNQSRNEILYEGTGSFVRHTGTKETLDWQCTVANGVVKNAHYSVKTDATVSADMVSKCQDAIRERIRNENSGTGTITFRTSRQSSTGSNRKLLDGTGYALISGEDANFDYQCIFNASGDLTDKKYEME